MADVEQVNLTRIHERIRLLQKAAELNKEGSPEEAALAAQKLHEMVTKYNLDLRQIQAHVDTNGYEKVEYDLDPGKRQTKRRRGLVEWRKTLLDTLCRENYCRLFVLVSRLDQVLNKPAPEEYSSVNILGQRHNVEVVVAMYRYLAFETERLAELAWLQNYLATYVRGYGSAFSKRHKSAVWKASFRDGVVLTIARRLRERRQSVEVDANSTALVTVVDAELDAAAKQLFGDIGTRASIDREYDHHGASEGERAGRGVALDKMVGNPTEQLAIGDGK